MTHQFKFGANNIPDITSTLMSMVTDHVCDRTRIAIIKSIVQYRKLHTNATFAKYALIPDEFVKSNLTPDIYRELESYRRVDNIYFLFQWWVAKLVVSLTAKQVHDIMSDVVKIQGEYTPEIEIERIPAWAFAVNTWISIKNDGQDEFSINFFNVNFWYTCETETRGLTITAIDASKFQEYVFSLTFINGTNKLNFSKFEELVGHKLPIGAKAGLYLILETLQFVCREPETKVVDIVKNPKTQKYSIDVAVRPKISTVRGIPTSPINRPHCINTVKDTPVEIKNEPKVKREDSFYVPPHCQKYYVGKRKKPDGSIIPLGEREYIIKKKAGYVAGGDEDGVSKNSNTRSVLN